jgi:hypothetical protein
MQSISNLCHIDYNNHAPHWLVRFHAGDKLQPDTAEILIRFLSRMNKKLTTHLTVGAFAFAFAQ